MSNAAIFFHPDGYDTTGDRLMGRHSAGESFLRGFIRHGQVDQFYFLNATTAQPAQLEPLLHRIAPPLKPVTWYNRRQRHQLDTPGALYLPGPSVANEAWLRHPHGAESYSLCGITHTTATHRVMDAIAELVTSPLQPWDALICTSSAVRKSIEVELDHVRADLAERLGATRFSQPKLATIPLGVNVDDFTPHQADRKAWRAKLNIPEDEFVVLYMGRFSPGAKMNPALMAMSLEMAAQKTGKPVHWIVAGWSGSAETATKFHDASRKFCPSITYHPLDGRPADTRFSIWAAADVFLSLSDNIQETFGLTPIEAMAAGLPCVVSDWDGYRDTVRHGLDGFRVATYSPRPGVGRDIAYSHANDWTNYDHYISATSQTTVVDLKAAADALVLLMLNPNIRARMSATAMTQAREVFDWAAIIPRYQALWAELDARRRAAPVKLQATNADNPRRLDPYLLFAGYPTIPVGRGAEIMVAPGMTWDAALGLFEHPFVIMGEWALPNAEERALIFDHFQQNQGASISSVLAQFQLNRRAHIERGVLWLVKFGILALVKPLTGPRQTN